MKKILMFSLNLLLAQPAPATLLTFDDLSDSGAGSPIANGYGGLNWNNFRVLNTDAYIISPSGYAAGTVSHQNVIFNAWSDPATITSASSFDLTSAILTAAWNDDLQVEIVGSADGVVLYDNTYSLSATSPTMLLLNYMAVDLVQFSSSGGTKHYRLGEGTHFCMDNLVINEGAAVIPESDTWFAGAVLALSLVASTLWRLRRALPAQLTDIGFRLRTFWAAQGWFFASQTRVENRIRFRQYFI